MLRLSPLLAALVAFTAIRYCQPALDNLEYLGSNGVTTSNLLNAEVAPKLTEVSAFPGLDDPWDLLFYSNVEQTLGFTQLCLGVEYGGGHFLVIDAGSSGPPFPNHYSFLNTDGSLDTTFEQPQISGWGWRDPAFDGTYFYAGCEYSLIHAIDTLGNLVPAMNIPKPASVSVVRGLAYDPATDHFWTANFNNPIVEFDRLGNVIWSGLSAPLTAIYGLFWDNGAPDGPWLWIYDQSGNPGTTFYQFDPLNHVYTGVSYTMPLLPGLTAQIAAGCGFTNQWDPDYWTVVGLAQGTPWDYLYVLEMYPNVGVIPPPLSVFMNALYPPVQIPANGGSFQFNLALSNSGTSTQTGDVWIAVQLPDSSWIEPIMGPSNLTLPAGGSLLRTRQQNVPGSVPAGTYAYLGKVGLYPNEVWDSAGFAFTKLGFGIQDSGIVTWFNTGESFPNQRVAQHDAIQNSSFTMDISPNPFNPSTVIRYQMPDARQVSLRVYDIAGRVVTTLVDGWREAGEHSVTFDGSGLASGVYLYRLAVSGAETTPTTEFGKMVLMK